MASAGQARQAADRFRAELAELRDGVVQAIRDGYRQLIDGRLATYQTLLDETLDRYEQLRKVVPSWEAPQYETFRLRPSTGQEVDWLRADYETFIREAVGARDPQRTRAVLEHLFTIVHTCYRRHDLKAATAFYRLLQLAWSDSGRQLEGDSWHDVRNQILDFHRSQVMLIFSERRTPLAERRQLLDVSMWSLTQIGKESVDARDPSDRQAWIELLRDGFDFSWADRRDSDSSLLVARARVLVSASIYGVGGWILLRLSRGMLDETGYQMHGALREVPTHPWESFQFATDLGTGQLMNWDWWELNLGASHRRGIAIQMGDFVLQELLLDAIARAALPTRAQLERKDRPGLMLEARLTASHLIDTIGRLEAGPVTARVVSASVSNVEPLRQHLDLIRRELKQEEERTLIQQPLSDDRIRQFQEAVIDQRSQRFRLVDLFQFRPHDSGAPPADNGNRFWFFGNNVPVSKDFFVDADVGDLTILASQFVHAQAQAEATYLLERFKAAFAAVIVPSDQFRGEVEAEVKRLSGRGRRPVVVVSGPWIALEKLRSSERRGVTPHERDPVGYMNESPIYWEMAGGAEQCVVVDLGMAGGIAWRPIPPLDAEVVRVEGPLLVGVRPIDQALASSLVADDDGFRRDGDQLLEPDEAVWRLQQRTQVRVLENLRWEPGSAEAGKVFVIENPDAE